MIQSGIYKITSPSGRIYVGQSNNLHKRQIYHKGGSHRQPKLAASIKKYGWDNHLFEVLHICEVSQLNDLEKYYADLFNVYDAKAGLNIRQCGGSVGYHSKETREKMSMKAMGAGNPMYGKKRSEEAIRKTAEANRGRKMSPEFCKKIGDRFRGEKNHFFGKKLSQEHKNKIKESLQKLRASGWRYNQSEATKAKMSKTKSVGRKIILNTATGIFYLGIKEAAHYYGTTKSILGKKLCGYRRNNTPLSYV